MKSWMAPQPGFHTGMLVGSIIVCDQMKIEFGRRLAVDFLQETNEFLMPMARHTIADYLAVEHAQGRKQRGGAVALVVVCHGPAAAFLHWQTRLSPVQGLDLTFLVDTQNQGLVGRIQIEPHNIDEFLQEMLVAAELEGFDQMRLEIVLLPDAADRRFAQTLDCDLPIVCAL